jgi:hypothetical protein
MPSIDPILDKYFSGLLTVVQLQACTNGWMEKSFFSASILINEYAWTSLIILENCKESHSPLGPRKSERNSTGSHKSSLDSPLDENVY